MTRLALRTILLLAFVISITLFACKNRNNENANSDIKDDEITTEVTKLLKFIYWGEGYYTQFDYDSQNQMIKMSYGYLGDVENTTIITYNTDGSVTVENLETNQSLHYVRNGDIITVTGNDEFEQTLTIDASGYITKKETTYNDGSSSVEFNEFENGNMVPRSDGYDYVYDHKRTKLNCNTPKWLLQIEFGSFDIGKNNLIEIHSPDGVVEYQYAFDEDGYPTEMSWEGLSGDTWWNGYEYY